MYTTDVRPNMTARQRASIERRMMTLDETGKPVQNYTLSNGARPDVAAPAVVHLHIHTDDDGFDPAVGTQSTATSSTSGREPALPGESIPERVTNLEVAVAIMAGGGDPDSANQLDDNGGVDPNQFATGGTYTTGSDPSDGPDLSSQIAASHVNKDAGGPPTPAEINEANRAMWNTPGKTTTGMGNHPPNSRAAEGNSYQPGAAGTINSNRRMSTVAKNDKMMGRTSGWGTSDMAMQDRAMFWRQQRLETNSSIAKINRGNAAARQRSNSWGV